MFYGILFVLKRIVDEWINWLNEIKYFLGLERKKKMVNCTGKKCPIQAGYIEPATCRIADKCPHVTKPMTNRDLVRAMSDEKLINLIINRGCVGDFKRCDKDCYRCWEDWFNKEVDDDIK